MVTAGMRNARSILDLPEFNVLLFAFLVNYPWEFLQVPFFAGMPTAGHWDAILFCTRATGGDALIALAGYWVVAFFWGNRYWILQPRLPHLGVFIAVGIAITIVFEWHATEIAQRWIYAEHMPVLPVLGTGLLPLLQWALLPPLIAWLVSRQIGR
ncbi:hypothetical protein [Aquisalimonas sp. 2447]|uniref:hypothetical protein n=1 Tax=Aquisalimonas sp. 2447 TaxID=2740807 RepID=UPI0020C36278|nr:hypothetical protein [Aquisalimonas sp. 2447]